MGYTKTCFFKGEQAEYGCCIIGGKYRIRPVFFFHGQYKFGHIGTCFFCKRGNDHSLFIERDPHFFKRLFIAGQPVGIGGPFDRFDAAPRRPRQLRPAYGATLIPLPACRPGPPGPSRRRGELRHGAPAPR